MAKKNGLTRFAQRAIAIANTPITLPGYEVVEESPDTVEWGQVATVEDAKRKRLTDLRELKAKRTLEELRDATAVCLKATRSGATFAWSDSLARQIEKHLTAAERDAILNAGLNAIALRLDSVCRDIREAGDAELRARAERIAQAGSLHAAGGAA
jgi:hypothetical protein